MAFGVGETAQLVAQLDLKDNFSKGIGSALGGLGRLESGLGRMSRGAGQVASGLDRLGTRAALAAGAGLTAVVTTAASFEQAFTGIEKTVNATEGELRGLEETFRGMARRIPVSFEDLAAIGEAGGALGIATEDLEEFTDVVARLSVSTNLSSEDAATALGHLGTVLHLSGGEFRDFADSLVNLGNKGASTESEIIEIANRFAAAGNAAGLSKEDILGLASAVASMGIQVEAGGSSLSRIFNSVATNIGTSSDKAEAFADTLGLSAKEFRAAWEKDAVGTFEDFLTALGKLDQFAQARVLKDIGITNTRDVSAVRLMAQNVDFVAKSLHDAADGQDALNKESQKFFDTTAGQWQILKNNLRDAAVTVGNELLPVVKDLVQEFTAFLNTPETRERLKEFGQNLADGIRTVVRELKGADFSGLIGGMKLAAQVAKGAFDAFRSLPEPIQQLAVAALVANKVSGGAVGQIARGFGNIFAGALQTVLPKVLGQGVGGALAGRGSTPLNPLFVSVVGGLGGPGGAPIIGGGAGGGLLGTLLRGAGKIFGVAAVATIGFELGKFIGDQFFFNPTVKPTQEREETQFEQFMNDPTRSGDPAAVRRALESVDSNLDELVGEERAGRIFMQVLAGDQLASLENQERLLREQLNVLTHAPPTGNFVPENPGGTPGTPAGRAAGSLTGGALIAAGIAIRHMRRDVVQQLRDGDIHAARMSQRQLDSLQRLRGTVDHRVNDVIPHLGRTNRALALANRNLDDGNRRQRSMAQTIRESRDATRTGFQRSNEQLGVISTKVDQPPTVNVTVPVVTTVSVNDIIRAQTEARYAANVPTGFTER